MEPDTSDPTTIAPETSDPTRTITTEPETSNPIRGELQDTLRRTTRSRNPSLAAREAAENQLAAQANRKQKKKTIYLIKVLHGETDPKTFDQALNAPDAEQWLAAIKDEINQMNTLDAWTLCEVPYTQKLVGSRWVFKKKDDGRYRARLVAKGYTQIEGLEYDQVYAPVMAMETFRTILAMSAAWGLHLIAADVKTAYLNGDLDVELFMEIPDGIKNNKTLTPTSGTSDKRLVLQLRKALYGLKQSGHAWYHKLRQAMLKLEFKQTRLDPCLYLDPQGQILVAVYVDDILFAGANKQRIYEVYELLASEFEMKMLGEVDTFLGIQIFKDNGIRINQQRKIDNLLDRLGLTDAYPKSTPLNHSVQLQRFREDVDEPTDIQAYQQLIGSLQHLSVCTRPDITYAVVRLSHYLQKPSTIHFEQAIHIILYLKGTKNLSIHYGSLDPLRGFCDSSYMADLDDSKSIEGYIFFLNGGAITWKSRKQQNLAMSTVEAEYMALSTAICEATHLRQKIAELEQTPETQTPILCDAQGAITLANKETIGHKVKHIRLRYHHIREEINQGLIDIRFVPTKDQAADILTKALGTTLHQRAIHLLKLING
jgi:hypothetical protein